MAVAVAVVAFIGFRYLEGDARRAAGRDRVGQRPDRGKLVDVAAKEPLRVKEILVDEGDLVKPGQVLVRMDTVTLEAELAEAKASVAAARGAAGGRQGRRSSSRRARSSLPTIEAERSRELVAERAGSQRELDVRKMQA